MGATGTAKGSNGDQRLSAESESLDLQKGSGAGRSDLNRPADYGIYRSSTATLASAGSLAGPPRRSYYRWFEGAIGTVN